MVANYLNFAGIEISNCRTVFYAQNGFNAGGLNWMPCTCCADDFYLVDNCGTAYTTPTLDKMGWVSTKEPDSADWAGLVITSIEGLDIAPTTRSITDRINDGGQFGRQRRNARPITVRAISVGRTCTAAWWGVRWLNEALRESSCASGNCGGEDLTYYLSCPDFKGSCLIPNSPSAITTAIAPYKRTLHDVALTDGLTVTDQITLSRCSCNGSNCTLPVVEFTLTAANPYAFAEPSVVLTDKSVFACTGGGTCPTWYVVDDGSIPFDPCAEPAACATDTVCATVPVPPDPPLLQDPCVCDPITLTTTCYDIPAASFSDLGQTVPVFTIKAGTDALRGLAVRFIPKDGNAVNACDTCFEINLPYLPPKATWTFDAAQRETTITCGGRSDSATVTGDDGGPLSWPVFECVPTAYAMCVTLGCGSTVTGVTVNASMVARHG